MAASQQSPSTGRDSSILPSVTGVHPGIAVAIAVGCSVLGAGIDAASGSELTSTFAMLYVLGCVIAILAVRYSGWFTATVQPPLVLFVIVPIAYQYMSTGGGTGLKDVLLNDAVPLVNRFPLMSAATLVVLLLAAIRYAMHRKQNPAAEKTPSRAGRTGRASGRKGKPDTAKDKLDRISAKAGALKSRSGARTKDSSRVPATAEPGRSSRPVTPDRGTPAVARSGGPRRDPRSQPMPRAGADPRYRDAPPPNRMPPRPRPDAPSHPMPGVRYRETPPPYDR